MRIPTPGLVALPGGRDCDSGKSGPDRSPSLVLFDIEDGLWPELFDCDGLGVEAIMELESFLRHPSRGGRDGASFRS